MSENHSIVRYAPVVGYPGYFVGTNGSMWSCHKRGGGGGITASMQAMKTRVNSITGRVEIRLTKGGRGRTITVHRLVLEAFIGSCPKGMEACHFPDRNPTNCNLDNLRWDTKEGNQRDKESHGTVLRGQRNPVAKLTDEQAKYVIAHLKDGTKTRLELSIEMNVSKGAIHRIAQRRTWRHLTPGESGTYGNKKPHAKITGEIATQIRVEYAAGDTSYAKLGRKYGLHFVTISEVVKREIWKHVP